MGRSIWVAGALVALAACGSDVEDSTKYRALRDERATLSEQLTDREASVDALADQVADLERQVREANDSRGELDRQLDANAAELAQAKQDLAAAGETEDAFAEFAAQAAYQWLGVSPSESDCLAEGLVADETARDTFCDMLSYYEPVVEGDEPPEALVDLFDNCGLDVEDFMSTVLAGDAYGDNPELDALWDACATGDGESCDNLFFSSMIDSDYETFGATCGDRFEDARNAGVCFNEDLATT